MAIITCIIELKSSRVNAVKVQAIEFEKVVNNETEFFHYLIWLCTDKTWNGAIRKIAVWPKAEGKTRKQKHYEVEEVNYTTERDYYLFH
jgi:hypothetical protein